MLNKLSYVCAVGCFISIIPVDFLAWWRVDVTQTIGYASYQIADYFDAFGQFFYKTYVFNGYEITNFGAFFPLVGIVVIAGGVLMLIGGLLERWNLKGLNVLGAILALIGPLAFLGGISSLSTYDLQLPGDTMMTFFGSASSETWYLGFGFFLPIISASLTFVNIYAIKSKEMKK